ncbi:MAG: lipoyl synthase [Phycisphaerales bacterium]|nr:lipoyl synthase [Phycisphaerales bacterium]
MSTTPQSARHHQQAGQSAQPRHRRPLGGDTARGHGRSALVQLGDQVLNNAPAGQQLHRGRKPDWIRAKAPGGPAFIKLRDDLRSRGLHTVCEEASCPNIGECWARGTATIMILGDTCTRSCGFCNVKTGKPPVTDLDEPRRVAQQLAGSGLKHVVITSVDRDDLPDGGADIWARTVREVHDACPELSVEALVGDFKGNKLDLEVVIESRPEILAHNLETVERMHPAVRPQARYDRSLEVLREISASGIVSKTSLMVGIGETDEELEQAMLDARQRADVEILTIGQYLQPTPNHLPVDRWVTPDKFESWKGLGLAMGYRVVESGPLVRSSYHAEAQAARHGDATRGK